MVAASFIIHGKSLIAGWADWLRTHLLVWNTVEQLVFAVAAILIFWTIGRRFGHRLRDRARELPRSVYGSAAEYLAGLLPWLGLLLVLKVGEIAFQQAGQLIEPLRLVFSLTLAWVVIRISTIVVVNRTLARTIAIIGWVIAALNIAGLIEPTIHLLDSAAIMVGTFRLSLFLVLKGAVFLAVLLWLAGLLSRLVDQRVRQMSHMAPAIQVLVTKLARVVLLGLAVVLALGSVGIDLTAFAVFSGAIGVGIGFGLQKVVSNLVSGIILLLDRSIKPGDVIQMGETYGWITQLNARYVSVVTRDGFEHLIPNEDLITQQVVNWTYSSDNVRLHVDVGVSYDADVRQALQVCVEAAEAVERVLGNPKPICLLTGFGDSTVNLQLRFWINDPRNGTANVKSQVMLEVWDRLHAAEIELPFAQRDLHIKEPEVLAGEIAKALRGGLARAAE